MAGILDELPKLNVGNKSDKDGYPACVVCFSEKDLRELSCDHLL